MEQQIAHDLLPKREAFLQLINNKQVDIHYLFSENVVVAITNYGARIVSLLVKDQRGKWTDVVIGFDSLKGYLTTDEIYHGAIIGRFANRIANGEFKLNDKTYKLATNNGHNHLHGGPGGFHNVVWDIEKVNSSSIVLNYESKDGEEGYPGTLQIKVTYTIEQNALKIEFEATSSSDTIINVTNHAYFNLNGQGLGSVEKHSLQINADYFTAITNDLIPTGELVPVQNTPFDFTIPKEIGKDINDSYEQIQYGLGYDHNFVLSKNANEWALAAHAVGDQTQIVLDVYTTEPGIQLYTGNFMKGINQIKYGLRDEHRSAFCLETQHFPDSPNHPQFPSTILKKAEVFQSSTRFQFSIALG